jgi:hypothetical protein
MFVLLVCRSGDADPENGRIQLVSRLPDGTRSLMVAVFAGVTSQTSHAPKKNEYR